MTQIAFKSLVKTTDLGQFDPNAGKVAEKGQNQFNNLEEDSMDATPSIDQILLDVANIDIDDADFDTKVNVVQANVKAGIDIDDAANVVNDSEL